MRKALPYIIVVIVAVMATKVIDYYTATDDFSAERKEMQENIEGWKSKFQEEEQKRIKVQKDNVRLKNEIETYEADNDTVVAIIRDANHNRNFARLDSLGENLEDRLRRRRQH